MNYKEAKKALYSDAIMPNLDAYLGKLTQWLAPKFREEGQVLKADYSQIELRIMAHISGDEGLLEAFNHHEDIHSTTAAKVFGVDQKEITRDMRRKAKEVNFGIMYGIGAFGLASRLDIAQSESKEIIQKYFERFPKVNQYISDTIASAPR